MGRPTDALTGFRFVAALHVLVLHETVDWLPDASTWLNTMLMRTAAVSFFFVLSGFVLVQAYGAARWRSPAAWRFAVGRMARLYPLYLLGLLLYAPFFVAKHLGEPLYVLKTWFVHVFLLQAWFPDLACTWNCPGWSVSATVFFALAFPLLCFLLRRRGTAALWTVLAAAFAAAQLGAWVYVHHSDMGALATEVFHKNPLVRLPEFIVGVAAGFLWKRDALDVAWLKARPTLALLGAAILGLFLWLPAGWSPYVHNGLLAPLFVALIAASIHRSGRTGAFLRHPRVQHLGRVSFAVYILHIPIARYLAGILAGVTGVYPRWTPTFVLIDVLVVLLVAGPAYHRFEEPMRRWVRARFGAPKSLKRTPQVAAS